MKRVLLPLFLIIILLTGGCSQDNAETATMTPTTPTVAPTLPAVNQVVPAGPLVLEAENGRLLDGAKGVGTESASGQKKAGNLGGDPNNAPGGSVSFEGISVDKAGVYEMTVSYGCDKGSKDRYFEFAINGKQADALYFDDFGESFDEMKVKTFEIILEAGENTLWLGNNSWYAPDLDRIELARKENPEAGSPYDYEAEEAVLGNGALAHYAIGCSGDQKVDGLGGDTNGYVLFDAIRADKAGLYRIIVSYCSPDRGQMVLTINDEDQTVDGGPTLDSDTPGQLGLTAELKEGINTIKIHNPKGPAPNLDKITVRPYETVDLGRTESLTVGAAGVEYSIDTGYFSFYFNGRLTVSNSHSEYKLGETVESSLDYEKRIQQIEDISDDYGSGKKLTVTSTGSGLPTLVQTFRLYAGRQYILTDMAIGANDGKELATNWMAPLVVSEIGGVDLGVYGDNRVIINPYDNDQWVEYESRLAASSGTSYEVLPFFDNNSRKALITGSVTHDTWKTGVAYQGSNDRLNQLLVYAGATPEDRDQCPHGAVTGRQVNAPTIMTGFYDDWREGMTDYGLANAVLSPKMLWAGEAPFGWNSWGEIQSKINLSAAQDVSDYVAQALKETLVGKDGITYINLDSYWDNMTDAELAQFVAHCHKNGQKAGIYWGPFVSWYGTEAELKANAMVPEGVEGHQYTYYDAALKNKEGKVLEKLDGAYTLDPTHPGTQARNDYMLDRFKALGFEYIKLDFMVGASLEGEHYDPKIQTGTQAYQQGMARIVDRLDNSMFISLAMAPLFPNGYAHARRIACDTFYSIENTKYELSALTYGFWINDTLYEYSDPDHVVVTGGTYEEARSRVNSAIISGTVFLSGDDLRTAGAQMRAEELYTNQAVLDVARIGKSFIPIEGNITGKYPAADIFVLKDKNDYYLALFNYDKTSGKTLKVDFERAGIDLTGKARLTDLWTGKSTELSGAGMEIVLEPMGSKLFKISGAN